MYVFLPPQTPSSAACALTFPPYWQICSTMVLTDMISDVFALLTPTLIPTCKRTYSHAPHTTTFTHANPRSPPHTRKRTPSYSVFPFPIYLLLHPYIPVHVHLTTSAHTHLHAHTHWSSSPSLRITQVRFVFHNSGFGQTLKAPNF